MLLLVGIVVLSHITFSRRHDDTVKKTVTANHASVVKRTKIQPAKNESPKTLQQMAVPERTSADDDNTPDVTTNSAGIVRYKNGPKFVIPPPSSPTIFTNMVDSVVASALAIVPGEIVYLSIPDDFDERFNEIIKSTTIFIDEGDSDEIIQLKADVLSVKKLLKERWANGESPKAVLEAELKELNRIAETYNYFKDGLNDLRRSGASAQERKDYVDAANMMLKNHSVLKKMTLSLDEEIMARRENNHEK